VPYAVGGLIVALLLGAIGWLPLFGGPGYEQSLASGLIVPSVAAIATALDTSRLRAPSPLASVGRGVVAGMTFSAISLGTALLHVLRVGICDLSGALVYFALTAFPGALLGGVWGAFVGELTGALTEAGIVRRRRLVAGVLAFLGPLSSIVVSVFRFWSSPMIFAFDPFVGYFSGTLYDTIIDAGVPLLTYRLGSLSTLVAVALIASTLSRDADSWTGFRLWLRTWDARSRALLGVMAGLISVSCTLNGVALGHYSTSASIAADLGAERHGARCDVVYPSTTRETEAALLQKDCEEQVRDIEQALGARGPERIRAFFFRDDADKKRLMGAAHTYIAKPWRNEVYLQLASYPHPVLGHELAHVIAGSFGRGPFRIAGALGGLLPNPGLIEGVAVAAAPDDDDLTDTQWAHAMLEIGLLPKMSRVFSFGFLGDSSAKSYTLAGAFITWVREQWGQKTVSAWYAGGDIHVLTGRSWPELDDAFRKYLKTLPLPAEAESVARARFSRPGIFGRRCPHLVDATRREADLCRDTHRPSEAVRLYESILATDPSDIAARFARAHTMRRYGDRERGRAELEAIAGANEIPRTWRDRADEALADADFIDGELLAARRRYADLAARSVDEDAARTLEVKQLATEEPHAKRSVQALLLGDGEHAPEPFVAGVFLGEWLNDGALPRSPFASYLFGRNLVQRGFYREGAQVLDAALGGELPTPRILREAVRQRAIAACATRDQNALRALEALLGGSNDPFRGGQGGRREATIRMIVRCKE
jgi:hypothetical protein